MAIGNVAMEARTIVDTQYTVHAAYDAANHAANNRSHRTSIVLTDARHEQRHLVRPERALQPTLRVSWRRRI